MRRQGSCGVGVPRRDSTPVHECASSDATWLWHKVAATLGEHFQSQNALHHQQASLAPQEHMHKFFFSYLLSVVHAMGTLCGVVSDCTKVTAPVSRHCVNLLMLQHSARVLEGSLANAARWADA